MFGSSSLCAIKASGYEANRSSVGEESDCESWHGECEGEEDKEIMSETIQSDPNCNAEQASQGVSLRVVVPQEALDVLGFRYYRLGIAKDDTALAQAAISEVVSQHFAQELQEWKNKRS